MQEKHNKVLFFLVRFSQLLLKQKFTIQHLKETKVYFPAPQFFPRPLTTAVIMCGLLSFSIGCWGKKRVSAQSQLNKNTSGNSHLPHIPNSHLKAHHYFFPTHALHKYSVSLTASVPAGEYPVYAVTIPYLYQNPSDLCSEFLRGGSQKVSHPPTSHRATEKLQKATTRTTPLAWSCLRVRD